VNTVSKGNTNIVVYQIQNKHVALTLQKCRKGKETAMLSIDRDGEQNPL
jgi:hypothetical protein